MEVPERIMRRKVSGDSDAPDLTLLGELRSEVQDLQAVLENVRKGEDVLKTYAGYIEQTKRHVAELLAMIKDGDSVQHLRNVWGQIIANPLLIDPNKDFDAQQQLRHLNRLDVQCRSMIFRIGVMTIPTRLNNWLDESHAGYYIPFHAVFEDEMPVFEDRVRMLNYLAWSPRTIKGGLVDPTNGLIYRYSRVWWKRLLSFILLLVALGATIGIVVGACYLPIAGWPLQPKYLFMLLAGWGAVLIGIVVHTGVATTKRRQVQGGGPPVIAIGDLPLLISAKIGRILLKLLLALVGFFGLVFSSGVGNVTLLNTFLVGYSLDSVVEIFSASVEQQAAAQVATLKQTLGVKTQSIQQDLGTNI